MKFITQILDIYFLLEFSISSSGVHAVSEQNIFHKKYSTPLLKKIKKPSILENAF